jgi:hypothetical protein
MQKMQQEKTDINLFYLKKFHLDFFKPQLRLRIELKNAKNLKFVYYYMIELVKETQKLLKWEKSIINPNRMLDTLRKLRIKTILIKIKIETILI